MSKRALKKARVLGVIIAIVFSSEHAFTLSGVVLEAGVEIKIEKEWKGYHCGYTEPSRLVIRTEDQWKEVWAKMHRLRLPKPVLPGIDFEKEMVLAVFMGERTSGGYSIEITKITKRGEEIIVEVREREPSPESLTTMALTQPYHLVMVKRFPLSVRFQVR